MSALSDLVRSGKVRAVGSSAMPASDIVDAQWVAERRGLERFRTEQPAYSILDRGIEGEVLPVAQRYGMGILTWSPLAQGLLTGRARKGQQTVEQLIALAEGAGLALRHMAIAFAVAHPGVSSAIIGPRTIDHFEDLLAGADVELSDDVLDRINEIAVPGTDVGSLDMACRPPALLESALRRQP